MKKINIMLGGIAANIPNLENVTGKWLGVDHGNIYLMNHGIKPVVSVGDYDSLNKLELDTLESQINDIRYANPVKDATDSQLGIEVALDDLNAERVDIYGATGGRIDHELVNIFLPLDLKNPTDIDKLRIIDKKNIINYFQPGDYRIDKITSTKYLGFFNLEAVHNLNIYDAKYQLKNFSSQRPVSFASNEFVKQQVHFSFDSGVMAAIQSKD